MAANNKTRFATIITTISIALFLVFWTLIDRRLQDLEIRLRTVENQLTAISVRLGIEPEARLSSKRSSAQNKPEQIRGELP